MKTKVIAVIVVLSTCFCAAAYSQNIGGLKGGNNSQPTPNPPVNNSVNNTATPTPAASPSIFSNQTVNGIYKEVLKSKEYKALAKKVQARVNATKVGKKANSFRAFLQRIGLAKKPARKVAPVK